MGGPRRSWDRRGSVLLSSCGSRSLLCPSWARFGVVFGCSWGRFGAFGGSLRCLNRRFVVASLCLWFRCVRCCFVLVFVVSCSLTHLLIYSSTHGPWALSNPAPWAPCPQLRTTNVGTLRRLLTETCLRFRGVRCCFVLVNSSTRLLVNPWPFGTFQPGPADCALRD